jgi:hypothetical protein
MTILPITEEHRNRFRADFNTLLEKYRRQEELLPFKSKWDGKINFHKVSSDINVIMIQGEKELPPRLKYDIAGMRNRFRDGNYKSMNS